MLDGVSRTPPDMVANRERVDMLASAWHGQWTQTSAGSCTEVATADVLLKLLLLALRARGHSPAACCRLCPDHVRQRVSPGVLQGLEILDGISTVALCCSPKATRDYSFELGDISFEIHSFIVVLGRFHQEVTLLAACRRLGPDRARQGRLRA